jgi:hypothetical protein
MSARSWTAGHPFDAGMTVPVFDRCLETVSQAHPLLTPMSYGFPSAAFGFDAAMREPDQG